MSFIYVEMSCQLDHKKHDEDPPLKGIKLAQITTINADDLFDCYTHAFDNGDAIFYQHQSPGERRRYFNEELGFPEVLQNPASFAYMLKSKLIGFALVMPYLEQNYHISCMCVLPEYQGHGLGKAMLNRIKNVALDSGCRSLSLGTEPGMKAHQLYLNNGFEVTAEHQVDM